MAAHLTLLITAAGDGELQLLVQRGDASGLGPGVWQGRHRYDAAAAQAELDALTRAARRALTRPGLDAVVAHGRLLFDLVLPAPVKAALRDPEGGTLLVAAGPLAHLPWPLLHDGAAPLGLRWALGEIVEGEAGLRPTTGRTGDRLLVVADPAGDLPAARFEGEALMRALAGDGGLACDLRLGRLRRADFLRMFKSFRVIHLAGHADAADETGPAGWRLADGRVDAEALAAVAGASAPQLVFANACQSARAPALVEALLRAGVRQVIGTVVDLPDLPGADFALQVYRGLREGLGVGEALRRARVQAAHADEPVWLAYRLFGDPRTPCFERAVAEVGGAGVRQGVVLAARAPWADADPETLADQAQRWRDAMRQAVQAHGGRLLPGRAAVGRAVFGVPISHENDAWRAARAALELADQAPAGTVLVLEAGPLTSTGADVLGHAVLAAEAACWVARPGVTALAGAARRLQGSAHLVPDEPGHRVLGLALGAALPTPPLVGRAAELDRLVAGLDGARRRGEAWAATLLGPAGQGKSRLVAAVVERAGEGFLTLRSPSPAYDEVQPFAGIATVLRGLLELGEARGPALRADLAAALGALEAPAADGFLSIDALLAGGERRGLIERLEPLAAVLGLAPSGRAPDPAVVPVALREVVEAVARRQPVLLVFEDVHALPAAALAVVDELVLGPVAGAVAVVCTARPRLLERAPRWGQGPRHLRLDLPPLAPAEAEALLAALLPPDTPPEVRRALAARAEGNPLFARELGLARADGAGDDAVPPTVEAVMTARLDRRTPLEREVLRAAATFGRSFWLAGVERLLGRPQGVAAAVAALAAGGFVIRQAQSELADQEEWRFAHALLQAVVEQGTRQRARRAWHGRAALWLAEEVAGGLAHRARIAAHLEAAGDHQRAAEAWLAAAAQAEAGLAPAEAAQALAAAPRRRRRGWRDAGGGATRGRRGGPGPAAAGRGRSAGGRRPAGRRHRPGRRPRPAGRAAAAAGRGGRGPR
ncbi:MAG: CHAT domain-containing protein [Myxococcales bacterium]|nr:CHAT domain-containing protein [Myxococcales bacterium]